MCLSVRLRAFDDREPGVIGGKKGRIRWHIPCSGPSRWKASVRLPGASAFAGSIATVAAEVTHPVVVGAALAFLVSASVSDIRSRRISNRLNGAAALVGLSLHGVLGGWNGLLFALAGLGVGFAALFLPFAAGMIGGGDVKFAAAAGTFLGWRLLLVGLAAGIILGGATAAVTLARRRRFMSAFRGLYSDILCWAGGVPTDTLKSSAATETLPYGVLLAMGIGGTLIAALFRWVPWASL
jgi:prepilin peptidase CpaA